MGTSEENNMSSIKPEAPIEIEDKLEPGSVAPPDNVVDPEDFEWSLDIYVNLAALYMTYFSCVWGQSAPGAAIGFISKAYPEGSGIAPWIAATTSLALCVIGIFIGDLSDIFGRRWFLIFASVCGFVGMMVSSRAESVIVIIGGQTISSVGITVGYLTTPLLAEIVPKRSRAVVISLTTLCVGFIGIGGNVALGAFMQYHVGGYNEGWRVGFYLGAGFFGISLILLAIFYKPAARPNPGNLPATTRLLKVDWIGIFLAVSALTLLLVGLQMGGTQHPWKSAQEVSLITVGGVLLITFGIWEWRFAKNKLIPSELFIHRNYAIGLIINFIEGVAGFGSLAFTSMIVLNLLEDNYLKSTFYNFPGAGGTVAGAGLTAFVVYKTREVRWLAILGCVLLLAGVCIMPALKPHINFTAWFFPQFIIGNAIGIFAVLNPVIASVCTPNEYVATSISVGSSIRGLGGVIAIVMLSTIFQNKIAPAIPARVIPAVLKAGLPSSSIGPLFGAMLSGDKGALEAVPGMTPTISEAFKSTLSSCYADSFRYLWYALIPFCVLTLVSCCFLKSTKLQITEEVTTQVQEQFTHKVHKDVEYEFDSISHH